MALRLLSSHRASQGEHLLNLIKVSTLLLLSFTCLRVQNLMAKPFRHLQVLSPGGYSEDRTLSKAIDCHITENLDEHTHFIRTKLFPRVSLELEQLLTPQISRSGQIIQVAETIDNGDLFHVHLRTPILNLPNNKKSGLMPEFTSQQSQHLQYHSFERTDLMSSMWLSQLESINNPLISNWVQRVEEYRKKKKPDPAFGGNYEKEPFTSLSEMQRLYFVNAWYAHQFSTTAKTYTSWVKLRLKEKIRILDPGDFFHDYKSLYRDRSLVSTEDLFSIIDPLNINGYVQPATIYFEERSDSLGVDHVLKRAESFGLSYIINSSGKTFRKNSFPKDTPWKLHQQLADELRRAANKENFLYVFKDVLSINSDYSFGQHFIFGWDDKYLFSIKYFLQCPEAPVSSP